MVTFYPEGLKVLLQQEYRTILAYNKKIYVPIKLAVHETYTIRILSETESEQSS